MGHGTHWEAVLNNVNKDIASVLDVGIQGGDVIGSCTNPAWGGPLGIGRAEFTLIQGAKSGFGSLGLIVKDGSARNYLHTAFPIATKGREHRVRILSVQESTFGLEARITAELGEAQITFFEPYHALNSDRYRPGSELDLVLAGIVYRLQIPDPNETVIHPEIGEVHLKGAASLLSMRDSDPGNLSKNGFGLGYVLAPSERPGPDDYTFRGPVKDMQAVDFLTRPAWRITATLLRINDGKAAVDIDLYVLDDKTRQGDRQ
jgi:hypothetical protein